MPMNEERWKELYDEILDFVRSRFDEEIDESYEFFWEEEYPEDFLSGTPLTLAFINFEDWMICDYRPKAGDMGGFIHRFIEYSEPDEPTLAILKSMESSFISLYEVAGRDGNRIKLNDLALNTSLEIEDPKLSSLNDGDVFAARIFDFSGRRVMGACVYPFGPRMKEKALKFLENMFKRFCKHSQCPTMPEFLKSEAYTFNTIWVSCLYKSS